MPTLRPAGSPPTVEARWRRRPVASALVRYAAMATPIAASVLAAFVMGRILPAPGGGPALAGWWLAIVTVSTLVLVAVDRMARRLLPLAVLLNLSMVFPDKAPARFWAALRAGAIRNLEQRLRDARSCGAHDEPAEAAARIITLVAAITAHDRRTRGHSERVRAFNDLIAEEMRLPEQDRDRLRWAALLHDVGKIQTPPKILNKPGPLTPQEWQAVYRHPENGARISAPLHGWLGPWAAAIEQHHERWDGAGYPSGLAREEISLGARIVAVADAYEVMTSPRPYRTAMSARAAREELARSAAGTQFDPTVVRAFLTVSLGKLRRVVGPIAWLLQFPLLASTSRIEAAAAVVWRQVVLTAGTATAVGVFAMTGLITVGPPPSARPAVATSSSERTFTRSANPTAGTIAPSARAEDLPVAEPAVPVTPAPSATTEGTGRAAGTPEDRSPDPAAHGPSRGRKKTPVVPPIEIRVPALPAPLPPVELPPIRVPGVDLPPTGTIVDDVLNSGGSPQE